jgi:protein O-GlcNAc transferase
MTNVKALIAHTIALHKNGELTQADAIYQQLLAVQPGHPQVSYLLGALRIQQGRAAEAIVLLEVAHKAKPDNVSVLLHLGNALQDLARHDEAVEKYDAALARKPDFADALNNRGNALGAMARFGEALDSFDAALAIAPGNAGAWYNRGGLLQETGRHEDAIASFDKALALHPDHADAFNNRGNALMALRQPAAALASFERAVALRPDNPRYRMNRAAALTHLDRFGEALAEYERILVLAPQFPKLFGQIALTALYECAWEKMAKIGAELPARVHAKEPGLDPWTLISYDADNALLLESARNVIRDAVPELPASLWQGEVYHHDRIRLAYVSADFRHHPVGFQIVELLERHDRARFEVIAISSGEDDGSDIRARIARTCDRFHDMALADDHAVAQKLRDLEVDIAVDLSGHTHGNRLTSLAWRPVPVQAAWLGYPGTTGADYMDFIIGDAIVTPPDHQAFYSETIISLAANFFPLDTSRALGAVPTRAEAGLPEGGFVFCCFNRNWKITAATFDIWMRLLRQLPGSVLWLREYTPSSGETLRREARARGIDPARLVFAGKVPAEVHMARHRLADLFLDTLPYNAHTTAADALFAGLPVLTQMGNVFAARVGSSLLTAAGLPELIADSAEGYEQTALALARDPARLKGLRDRLAANRATAPLFDMNRFARDIEAAYIRMLAAKA